ncbi:DUF1992 domain-containing protein [Chloroflexales bacterium ZM16-3]|nr:DUF1992 domain-containing protein [Chloroflexales bacterium ZM16-3]
MSEPPRDERNREEEHNSHPLRRVTQRTFESLIDQHVRAAEEAGEFRDLPGAGKPLSLDSDDQVPEDLRTGFRMLKNAGYAPPWIELQKSIREEQERLAAWLAQSNRRWPALGPTERDQLRAEYEQRLRDLNKQISSYNLTAPPVAGQLPLLQPWRELRKLGE